MKTNTILIIITSLVLAFHAETEAQDYVPLAIDGAHWVVGLDKVDTPIPFDAVWEYHTNGDTMADGQTYLKVYRRDLELNESFLPPFNPASAFELVALMREDIEERKVYATLLVNLPILFSNCPVGEESLLFDFSLAVGDTASFCTLFWENEYIINAINNATYWGMEIREFHTMGYFYLEGIGSAFGLFETMFIPVKSQDNRNLSSTGLLYYCRDTPCDYVVSTKELPDNQALKISPNPATNQTWLELPENTPLAKARIELYSSSGRLLQKTKPLSNFHKIDVAHLPKGLYLVRLWDGESWYVKKLVVQ